MEEFKLFWRYGSVVGLKPDLSGHGPDIRMINHIAATDPIA
jgi:hypothetical protein